MPIEVNGQPVGDITLNGNTIGEVQVNGTTVYTSQALPVAYSNLVAWYPFDSATYGGSNANDVTAIIGGSGDDTAYDGSVGSTPSYLSSGGVTDINGASNSGAFSFNNPNVSDGITTNFDMTHQEFSISAFVNQDTTGDQFAVSNYNPSPGVHYVLGSGFNNRNYNFIIDDGSQDLAAEASFVDSGVFRHLVGTHDNNTGQTQLYVDGSLEDTTTTHSNVDLTTESLQIGSHLVSGISRFRGDVDDVRVYNKILSSQEVNQIYQNTQP